MRGVLIALALVAAILAFLAGLAWVALEPQPRPIADTCRRETLAVVVDLSHDRHRNVLAHERRALAAGKRRVLVLERDGADARRRAALRGEPTAPGMDRDEYPPAISTAGGAGADVELVPAAENRSAGALMGAQLRAFCDGQAFVVEATP